MGRLDAESETLIPVSGGCIDVAHALRAEGFDASEDGTGRGTPIVPVLSPSFAIQERAVSENVNAGPQGSGIQRDHAYTIEARNKVQAVCFQTNGGNSMPVGIDVEPTMVAQKDNGSGMPAVATKWAVRRLTPREAERLQGFPDDFTRIPYRNGDAADGPRYKALGNSMAVNCMRWIGKRIDEQLRVTASQPQPEN